MEPPPLQSRPLTNWAGNIAFAAQRVHRPESVDELRDIVATASRVRAIGTAHSFNDIVDTDADLVSVAALPAQVLVDEAAMTATVSAGLRYGELATQLDAAGFALANLGSLPHIGVAGACATATHGSGDRNGCLSTSVEGLEFVTAGGELTRLSRPQPDFAGSVVALGALGVITTMTLRVVPRFEVRQHVYEQLPAEAFRTGLDEIFGSAYSVSIFTDWRGPALNQLWVKERHDAGASPTPAPRTRWGATLADGERHPIAHMPAANCTQQEGVPGPWHRRLPHFRLEFTPSSGAELQTEYLVPRQFAVPAFDALDGIRARIAPVLQISEIRTIAADDLWLSPAYQRDSIAFHFTWIADTAEVAPVIADVERVLEPFSPRPHWGKLFAMQPEVLRSRYERLTDFQQLLDRYDPAGKFRNAFVDRYVGER